MRNNRISLIGCLLSFFAALLWHMASVHAAATSWKLAFGAGVVPDGFTLVKPGDGFDSARGFGFETITAGHAPAVVVHGGCVSSDAPFYFSVAVPEGNYRVTLSLGDDAGESDTVVKAELRRLMLENVHAASGQTVSRSFVVNVRTPKYAGGSVHLKSPRETTMEAWAWDEKLTLEFNGARPCLRSMVVEKVDVPTVYILGDSTVCDQPGEPYASWGQMLPRFFKPDVAVSNQAESGETLRSSTGAHRIDKVLSGMKAGDYLLIQYGHNDMKIKDANAIDVYEATLKDWCERTKQKGGTPILITSMNRHSFKGNVVTNSLGDYPERVRSAGKAEGVTVIDLNLMSKSLYEALGPEGSIALFEHEPNSKKFDQTHHSPYGAYELAKCVIEGIRKSDLELKNHIAADAAVFDPAKPDGEDQVKIPRSPSVTNQRPLGD
jgi:lysophospholipase L1-like esterase